jgi:hypothetical protein
VSRCPPGEEGRLDARFRNLGGAASRSSKKAGSRECHQRKPDERRCSVRQRLPHRSVPVVAHHLAVARDPNHHDQQGKKKHRVDNLGEEEDADERNAGNQDYRGAKRDDESVADVKEARLLKRVVKRSLVSRASLTE